MRAEDFHAPQPPPAQRDGAPSMHDVAIALHRMRRDHGLTKYGSLLQAVNGRNAGIDEVQELLDGLVYRIQTTIEAEAQRRALADLRERLRQLAVVGDSADAAHDLFEEMLSPAALAARADEIAQELLADTRPQSFPELVRDTMVAAQKAYGIPADYEPHAQVTIETVDERRDG